MIMKIGILKTVQDPRKGLNPGKERLDKVCKHIMDLCAKSCQHSLCERSLNQRGVGSSLICTTQIVFVSNAGRDLFGSLAAHLPIHVMTALWRRNCSSGADMWPTPQAEGMRQVPCRSTAICACSKILTEYCCYRDLAKF